MAGPDPEHVREKALGEDAGVIAFAIVVEGEVAGMIQYYVVSLTDPSGSSDQCGLCATSHGWPSGSRKTPE